jgi:hypothetical protein
MAAMTAERTNEERNCWKSAGNLQQRDGARKSKERSEKERGDGLEKRG